MTAAFTSEKLAEFISSVDDVPELASEAAQRCILDAVSAAVAGANTSGASAAREGTLSVWGKGSIPIWLSSQRSTEIGAAFANSAAVCMLDFDDGHRAAAGHPGASIIPAVLAAVHEDPSLQSRATTAIILGYEVGLRIAASRDLRTLDTVNSGRWCGQGAAAAVGWLKGLPPRVIAEAISAAAAVAPLMAHADFTQVGNNVKEGIPYATANGLSSLHFAQAGFAAPLDILDDTRFFDTQTLLDGLGESWMIETCYFKPYSCCRWIHAAIDALLKIMSQRRASYPDITKIRVETFGKALTLPNQVRPGSLEAAQFSVPFCLGVTAVHGTQALVPMTNPALLMDPDVCRVSTLVELVVDEDLDSHFSAAVPARVTVRLGDREYVETVMAPLGEPSNPMSWDALFEKFHVLATSNLVTEQEQALRAALDQMRLGNLASLIEELSRPATKPNGSRNMGLECSEATN